MGYKALYRKYRPSKFEDFAGQKQIVEIIQNAIKNEKVAHAYLFCGPRGTGKTSMAKMLAKAVNCTSDNKPCNMCDNCEQANNNNHSDIIELDAASNNGVDQIRDIIEKSKYLPVSGKYKIYIIDEVHMLSSSAFNALLKTLEEPPAHVIFILATTEPHKVLATIVSRCQKYNFSKVSDNEIIKRMKELLDKENIEYTEPALSIIANLSEGGVRDALSLLEQVIATGNNINEEVVTFVFGKRDINEYIGLILAIVNNDFDNILYITNEIVEKGGDLKKITNDLVNVCKASMIYNKTKNPQLIKGIEFEKENLEVIEKIDINKLMKIAEIMLECEEKYKFIDNVETLFELSILKAANAVNSIDERNCNKANTIDLNETKEKELIIKQDVEVVDEQMKESTDNEKTQKDVEEIKLRTISDHIYKYDKNELLNFFVGANKQARKEDEDKLSKLPSLLGYMKLARYTNIIKNSKIVASGTNYIVLMDEFEPNVNQINESNTNQMIETMLKEEMEINKKVVAITEQEYVESVKMFKELSQQNKLPKFKEVFLNEKIVETVKQNDYNIENKLNEYFDESVLKIVEE